MTTRMELNSLCESLFVCRACRVTRSDSEDVAWTFTGLKLNNHNNPIRCEMCGDRPVGMVVFEMVSTNTWVTPAHVRWAEPITMGKRPHVTEAS